jgi:archaellin
MINIKKVNKRAMMGVGVLLIFIATILTSAIAAGVLVRTSGLLQSKTIEVERTTRERITNGLEFVQVIGYANTTAGSITDVEILVRLKPGSSPIKLADTYLTYTVDEVALKLPVNESMSGTSCSFTNMTAETSFCYEALFGNSNSIVDIEETLYLRFKLNATNAMLPQDYVELQFISKLGDPTSLDFRVKSISTYKVILY